MADDAPSEWIDPAYAEVVEHVKAHAAETQHRTKRHPRPAFGGVPSFIVRDEHGGFICIACQLP